MKIKVAAKPLAEVRRIPKPPRQKPVRPARFWRWVMKTAGAGDLKDAQFSYAFEGMDRMPEEPCLVVMNHSSFIDLEIAARILYPHPFNIICTSDGFVGKEGLMRRIGCIPTDKFVTDLGLIAQMSYALHDLGDHVLLYPEASYTFDGCATPLLARMGVLLKKLKVPVVLIKTEGAFLRDPLYNCLQKRHVKVSAKVSLLASAEEIRTLPAAELTRRLEEAFTFDNFRDQQENQIRVDEPFRADGLHRILYKCPECGKEGEMEGKGTQLICSACGASWTLDETGLLRANAGEGDAHIPDWYAWERQFVRSELENGTYRLDTPVRILVFRDFKAIYDVGHGRLTHDNTVFTLTDGDDALIYRQDPGKSYSLYADYYWYEIGDIICIGDSEFQYYCLPEGNVPVAKARLATEELFWIVKKKRKEGE